MKTRTQEEVTILLHGDLAWRKKELHTFKSEIERKSLSLDVTNALLRSGIIVLYAHWEGFVKTCASAYVEYVFRRRLRYRDLTPGLLTLAVRERIRHTAQSGNFEDYHRLVRFLVSGLDARCNLKAETSIQTNSNLGSTVFRDIVLSLNLDWHPYTGKEKLINERLLAKRNLIAHGGDDSSLRLVDFGDLSDEIIGMMTAFRNQILSAIENKSYKNSTAQDPQPRDNR